MLLLVSSFLCSQLKKYIQKCILGLVNTKLQEMVDVFRIKIYLHEFASDCYTVNAALYKLIKFVMFIFADCTRI